MVLAVQVNSMKNGPLGNYMLTPSGLTGVEMIWSGNIHLDVCFGLSHVSEFGISVGLEYVFDSGIFGDS